MQSMFQEILNHRPVHIKIQQIKLKLQWSLHKSNLHTLLKPKRH